MVDFGYDISDFRDVDGPYGTMKDIEELTKKAKEHGVKVGFSKPTTLNVLSVSKVLICNRSFWIWCLIIHPTNTNGSRKVSRTKENTRTITSGGKEEIITRIHRTIG